MRESVDLLTCLLFVRCLQNLDLSQLKLLHDGLLISKKNPGVQLHGLLFENIMVLLQKLVCP